MRHLVRLPISPLAPLHSYINSEKRWFKHPSPGLRSTGTQSPFPDGQPDWQVQQVQSQPCLQNTQALSPTLPQTTISFLQFLGKSLNPQIPVPTLSVLSFPKWIKYCPVILSLFVYGIVVAADAAVVVTADQIIFQHRCSQFSFSHFREILPVYVSFFLE